MQWCNFKSSDLRFRRQLVGGKEYTQIRWAIEYGWQLHCAGRATYIYMILWRCRTICQPIVYSPFWIIALYFFYLSIAYASSSHDPMQSRGCSQAAVKHCIIADSTLVGFRRPVTWFASTTRTLFKRKRCLLMMKCIFKENLVDYFWDEW